MYESESNETLESDRAEHVVRENRCVKMNEMAAI
jgi:hypothetical protein